MPKLSKKRFGYGAVATALLTFVANQGWLPVELAAPEVIAAASGLITALVTSFSRQN